MVSMIQPPLMIGCRLRMKGTMSEAELHILRARLRGGILNQAQRAALKLQLPVGLVYVEDETIHLDPDAQVQGAFRTLFATFKRTGSAWATRARIFGNNSFSFPIVFAQALMPERSIGLP